MKFDNFRSSPAAFVLACALAFFFAALTPQPSAFGAEAKPDKPDAEANPRIAEAEQRLEAWRIAEADKISAALLKESPRSPDALALAAEVAFYQGRYDEAARLAEQALAGDSANERRQALRIRTQRSRDIVGKMKRYESEHFLLYLDEAKDGLLAPYALDTLEKSYRILGQTLGYMPAEKVRVEIAPDSLSFNGISTLSRRDIEETGAVGICKFNKVMIISPRVLLQGYRWLDSLSHEYAHYVIVGASDNKTPIWLHEGLARYYETLWRRPDKAKAAADYLSPSNQTLLAQALDKNSFVGFKKMEPSLIYLDTPEQVQLAYAEAASAVDFLVSRKGEGTPRELLAVVKTRPTPEAIEKVLAEPYAAFEKDWKDFLRAKHLTPVEGSRVRRLKVVEGQKEQEDVVELKEIQSAVARNRTHLADELQQRGRIVGATEEYRRALQASPGSPIILGKLARVLIRQSRYQEALPHLQKALELDPDSVSAYVQLGRLHHANKEFAAAKADLEEALQINPFNPEIYAMLADAYAALGEQEQAKRAKANLERLARGR
ncbi:MAG TPA: tetratricopeptide repeat protein [Candidatus Binatia bacterium]